MAIRTFLGSGDTFTAANNGITVFGASGTGTEKLLIQSGVTGVITDANIERVELAGNLADYKFVVTSGTGIVIQNTAGTVVGTIPSLNQNATVAFADGSTPLVQTGATTVTLGGQALSTTTATAYTTTTLGTSFSTTDKSTVPTTTTSTTPTFSVAVSAANVTEGSNATFTVSLSSAQTSAVTVNYTLAATGTAALGTDTGTHVPAGNSGTLTFAAGEVAKTVVVPITFDANTETGEGMTLTLSNASTGTTLATSPSAAVSFVDPSAPTYTVTSNGATMRDEGQSVTFSVTPSGPVLVNTTMTYTINGDTLGGAATGATGADFSSASGSITFTAGQTAASTVSILLTSGDGAESLEGYKFIVLDSTLATVGSVTGQILDGDTGNTGATAFPLTTGIDTATSKTAITGILSDTSTERTWSVTDTLSGSVGSTDYLTARIIGDNNGTSYAGLVTSGIETINFQYSDANDASETNTIVASGFSGATKIAVKDSTVINSGAGVDDIVTLSSVTAGTVLEVSNNAAKLNVNYTSVGTATSGDSVTLNTAGGATGDITFNDAAGDGFVTVNVATSGTTASTLQKLAGGSSTTTIKVTGTAGLTITDNLSTSNAALTSFDASGNSGAVNVTATGATTLNAKGGSGTTDALTLSLGSSVSSGMAVSGFETVNLQATANASVTGSLITGATATNVKGSTTNITGNTLTLNEFASGTGINIVGTGTNAAQYANAVTLVQTGASSGTADSVAVKLSNGGVATTTTNVLTTGLITAANIETVTFDVVDFTKVDSSMTIANAKTLTLTGAAELDLATFTGSSAMTSIDASTYTGKLTFGTLTDVTGDLTFKGSTGIDSVTNAQVAATKTQTFNLGAGADTMDINEVSANANATLTVNGDAGDDVLTVQLANGTASVGKLTFNGGADSDTLRVTGTGDTLTATISGIEKINLEAITNAATLDLTLASGFAETVLVTDVSGQTEIIKLNVAAGGSINGSNLSFLGWTEGTDVLRYLSTTSGNESFTFGAKTSAGGAITETYTIVATNGIDNITGFTPAANEDIIDATALAAFLNGGTTSVATFAATTTAGAANNNVMLLTAAYYADAAAVLAALPTGGAVTVGSGIAGAAAHALIAYQTASGSAVRIAEATVADAGGFTAVTDLVVLTGVTTITDLVASNFTMD